MSRLIPVILLLAGAAVLLVSKPPVAERPGPLPSGGTMLVTGWTIKPAGRQTAVDTFPMSIVRTPGDKYLLVLNGGVKPPSISVIDTASEKEVQRLQLEDAWLGLAINAAGDRVYAGGGIRKCVHELAFEPGGALRLLRSIPAGGEKSFIGDVAIAPDGTLWVADLYGDAIHHVSLASSEVLATWQTGRRPYRITTVPGGESFLVSSWGDNRIVEHSAATGERIASIDAGPHASDMVFDRKGRLFVAVSNTNTAAVYRKIGSWTRVETLSLALAPNQPVGMTPSAVSLSADETLLFVVCSDANAVAVVDVSGKASRVKGFIPAAWYPTAAAAFKDGRLAIANGRGLRSFPNTRPLEAGKPPAFDYVGRIQTGTVSFVDPPDAAQLKDLTATVLSCSPWKPKSERPGKVPPIEHVVYIIKENRTYDQVLGDLGKGNGDASLTLFGEEITPNQHKLAREFVLFDNFYVNADVSADGHNWSMAGIAPDFVQKVWPNGYGGRRSTHRYRWGQEPAAMPPAGYLWDRVHEAGLSLRSYGYLGVNRPLPVTNGPHVSDVLDPVLKPNTDVFYRDYDLGYPDVDRAREFLRDFGEFEKKGEWVRFTLIRLGNNHTEGTTPGRKTPRAHVADNDAALGLIVEGISRSRFWPKTAIFVLEDDAQNGPDHVDSHRSPAFVISPFTRRGAIDSAMYNTTSMLRSMEMILGVRPMTVFDASSRPMFAAFAATPDLRPFAAEAARVPLDERNARRNPTAARSLRLDFSQADEIDDDELNAILWAAMKGTAPPAPVRSAFGN